MNTENERKVFGVAAIGLTVIGVGANIYLIYKRERVIDDVLEQIPRFSAPF